ncbi:MAG: hypothetical protein OEN02_04705 [Gammaproteobacteria bacterium]|nr:hypothetical protein [Gammaproteobacteria bacterium]MDH3537238.1 hypothetical protein [Gammaproteobacteria bacterium]
MNQLTTARTQLPSAASIFFPVFVIVDCLAWVATTLESWRRRQQESMQFARVEARILRDVGISEAQRFIAVNEPFHKSQARE